MAKHWAKNDGGRAKAGYKGNTGDCVTRAIAIATKQDYQTVYDGLIAEQAGMRQTKRILNSHPCAGVSRKVYESYLNKLGWKFTPTMFLGSGCQVHLKADELPKGRIIARLSKHLTAVVDGVIQDTHDCSRESTRCVYGYFSKTK